MTETYNVYRDGAKIASDLTVKAYDDTTVQPATAYVYKVGAVNEAGETLSEEIPVTTLTEVVTVTGVTLDQTTLALEVGATGTLTPTIAPANATDKTYQLTSSDPAIATVTPVQGKVTGVAAGTAIITVTTTDGAKTATCEVTVTAP